VRSFHQERGGRAITDLARLPAVICHPISGYAAPRWVVERRLRAGQCSAVVSAAAFVPLDDPFPINSGTLTLCTLLAVMPASSACAARTCERSANASSASLRKPEPGRDQLCGDALAYQSYR